MFRAEFSDCNKMTECFYVEGGMFRLVRNDPCVHMWRAECSDCNKMTECSCRAESSDCKKTIPALICAGRNVPNVTK